MPLERFPLQHVPKATPLEGTMQSDCLGVQRRRLPFTLVENIVLEDRVTRTIRGGHRQPAREQQQVSHLRSLLIPLS